MKTLILRILICLLFLFYNCKQEKTLPEKIAVSWEYAEIHSTTESKLKFEPLENPKDLEKKFQGKSGNILLRTKFDKPKIISSQKISVYLDLINPTDETFLNGIWIGATGKTPERDEFFFSAWNEIRNYQIEETLLKEKDNELLIKIYFEEEISFSGKLRIGSKAELDKLKLEQDFFRSTIYLPIFFLLIVIGAFYLLVYFKRRQDKEFLYYALIAFFSSISQTNFFILKIPIECELLLNYLYFQKIVFASICLFIWTAIQYSNSILRKKVNEWEKWVYFSFTVIPAFIFLISIDYAMVAKLRTPLFMISSIFGLSYIITLVIYKTYTKHKNAKIFLLGLIPFSCCITFDLIIHNLTRNDELIYLSFLGMPSFIVAIGIVQANDFVNYRIQLEELNKSLERRVLKRTERLQLAKEETEKALFEMKRIARIDPLTNLFNRLHLMNSLENEMQRAKRYKLPMSLLVMDIDFFKAINDTYGHLGGDEVLKKVGFLVEKTFRSIDISGRFGGEEFCIILPNTKQEDGFIAAEKLRKIIEISIILFNEQEIKITCSIGVSEYRQEDTSISQIIERADTALYAAKRNGRNRTVISH